MAQKSYVSSAERFAFDLLLGDISAVDVLITVANAAVLPQTFPFPLTIGIDRTVTETVMVTTANLEKQSTDCDPRNTGICLVCRYQMCRCLMPRI